ncbi:MAG TPA: hypothetical protein VFR35_07195 [Actinoplanes sp.]|nr:hypothetical protein [Actinoplanes sp.]
MDVRQWLVDRGADAVAHPGGTLFAHLNRVHDRLAAHGCAEEVCRAGLTHAAYGTEGFPVVLLDPTERAALRAVVGPAAEEQVYRYGGCDRGRTWRALGETLLIRNRFTGHVESPTPAELRAFVDLSIVNELDVAEHDPAVVAKHGDYFRDIFESWAALASPAVVDDFRTVLYQVPARRTRQGRPSGS